MWTCQQEAKPVLSFPKCPRTSCLSINESGLIIPFRPIDNKSVNARLCGDVFDYLLHEELLKVQTFEMPNNKLRVRRKKIESTCLPTTLEDQNSEKCAGPFFFFNYVFIEGQMNFDDFSCYDFSDFQKIQSFQGNPKISIFFSSVEFEFFDFTFHLPDPIGQKLNPECFGFVDIV